MAFQKPWRYFLVLTLVTSSCSSDKADSKTESKTQAPLSGKALFEQNCSACHGEFGDGVIGGAANLRTTKLSEKEINQVILNGKGTMPALGSLFSPKERERIVTYVQQFKK